MDDKLLAQFMLEHGLTFDDVEALTEFISDGGLEHYQDFKRKPVDPKTFLLDPFYLGLAGQVYPPVLREFLEMNSGSYVEIVLTGAIGTAKTTLALWNTAYQLYLLSCYRDPQKTFGLAHSDEILVIFQSITADLAKKLDYARFKALIEKSPYFQRHFPYNKHIESELQFANRIIVRPVAGHDTAAIGQNVIGGIIDELNYMAVVENSKASVDGGSYDQATSNYNSIARRRKSRFMQQGAMPGLLCLVSSKRYPGQFTDKKEEEAKTDPTIYVYDKRVWDIKPGAFTGVWFPVFIGDTSRQPRILDSRDDVAEEDQELVMDIPIEYRGDFDDDIMNALREIAGVSTLATHPYIMNTTAVAACFGQTESIFAQEWVDFDTTRLGIIKANLRNRKVPRFAHVDLGITGDSAGVCIGHVDRFDEVPRGAGQYETMPHVVIDGILEVRPPKGGEIKFWKIREIFYALTKLGLNIRWVTYDSFQSTDSMQLLRAKGYITGVSSMDASRLPYDMTKQALYDGRVDLPDHAKTQLELVSLEEDPQKRTIDHPPSGSKDCSDALAGVVSGLTLRREIWALHNVPPTVAPQWLQGGIEQQAKHDAKEEYKRRDPEAE